MKRITLILFALVFFAAKGVAQNKTGVKPEYQDICKGVCLQEKQFSSQGKTEHHFTLLRKKTARFYLFKEAGKEFPNINIYDFKGNHISDFTSYYFPKENYMYIEYMSPYNRDVSVKLRFRESDENAKADLVLSYDSPLVIINKVHQPNAKLLQNKAQ